MEELEPIEVQRNRCRRCRDALRDLTRIHVEIDTPSRTVGTNEPDWVFRLRKVCLHAVAITRCEINVDGVHVITTELRAAYEQMDAVSKRLPDECRFAADGTWWSNEARDGLAAFNHPTMLSLALSLASGGFAEAEDPRSYLQLAVWLGRLGCGYGLALVHLAGVLGTEVDIDSRLATILGDVPD